MAHQLQELVAIVGRVHWMIYKAYQAYTDVSHPVRLVASHADRLLSLWTATTCAMPAQRIAAWCEVVALAGFTHSRPEFEIPFIEIKDRHYPVTESVVLKRPFGDLLHFRRDDLEDAPKVLLIAPMSGHFATLLRGTIRTLLRDYDVYVSDWKNVREIPLSVGDFGLDDYIEYMIEFIKFIGPQTHVIAVCQPTVAALAATAVMAQDKDNNQPASLTLMAGPIDVRVSPTKVNDLANQHPISWFREKLIGTIPPPLGGAGRRVYPGFLQLSAFMSMNWERHQKSFADLYKLRIEGEHTKADAIRDFYQEYFAIMDLAETFYIETIEEVFQKASLPQGRLMYKGRLVDPKAIRKTFLLTVEGERDDICAVGQTLAAQDLCAGLRPYMKSHYMQPGVGHYGVFNGRKWEGQIYPVVKNHIQASI
jgi:poly(3-hydroxybutyrate) depolymerase